MTSISLDTFLKIGHNHKICEDYVLSGMTPIPHIILADGCSSSKNTEMGARLLCYLARQFLILKDVKNSTYEQMGNWIISNSEMAARQLGLNLSSLDSTLIVSYYIEEKNIIETRFYGDGFLIEISNLNQISIYEVKFTKNAPYYLSYRLDQVRDYLYHGLKTEMNFILTDFETEYRSISKLAYDYNLRIEKAASHLKLIMICSDGLSSFYDEKIRGDNLIEVKDLLPDFTNFKNTTGVFLQRTVKKAIEKYEKQNIFHFDDLSMGAFLIGENQKE